MILSARLASFVSILSTSLGWMAYRHLFICWLSWCQEGLVLSLCLFAYLLSGMCLRRRTSSGDLHRIGSANDDSLGAQDSWASPKRLHCITAPDVSFFCHYSPQLQRFVLATDVGLEERAFRRCRHEVVVNSRLDSTIGINLAALELHE